MAYLIDSWSDHDDDKVLPVLFVEVVPPPRPRDREWLVFDGTDGEFVLDVVYVELGETKNRRF